jgi:hypothetical protein
MGVLFRKQVKSAELFPSPSKHRKAKQGTAEQEDCGATIRNIPGGLLGAAIKAGAAGFGMTDQDLQREGETRVRHRSQILEDLTTAE